MIAIKDMAGLLGLLTAEVLVSNEESRWRTTNSFTHARYILHSGRNLPEGIDWMLI
jgi:hypothetical protein